MEDLLELDDTDIEVDDIETLDDSELDSTVDGAPSKRQPKSVNLDEFPEFQKFKSASQKREAAAQRAWEDSERSRRNLEDRLRQIEMQGLDDNGRIAYENQELRRRIIEMQEDQARRYQQFQWDALVDEVSRETGVPVDDLVDAKDSNDLWRIGRKYERENGSRRRDDDDDVVRRPVDDRVHLGGSKPSSVEQKIQRMYDKALDNFSMDGMFAAEEEAIKRGIKLKHQQ